MPDIAFRDYLPYHKNVVTSPIVVTVDEPVFELLNELDITDNLPAGSYVLTATWEWSMSDTNDSALFRFVSPISIGTIYRYEPKDNNDLVITTAAIPFEWAGGSFNAELEASTTDGGSDLIVSYTSLETERKA